MTIQDLTNTPEFNQAKKYFGTNDGNAICLTSLVFGGQGSVYISIAEYCPAKKQIKLKSELKETYKGPMCLTDLFLFPKDTEILIEGETELDWVTPDWIEFNENSLEWDFQHILDDNQKEIIEKYQKEIHTLVENMESDDIPDFVIKRIIQQGTKGYLNQ